MNARCDAAIESKMAEERYKPLGVDRIRNFYGNGFRARVVIFSFSTNNVRTHDITPDEVRWVTRSCVLNSDVFDVTKLSMSDGQFVRHGQDKKRRKRTYIICFMS